VSPISGNENQGKSRWVLLCLETCVIYSYLAQEVMAQPGRSLEFEQNLILQLRLLAKKQESKFFLTQEFWRHLARQKTFYVLARTEVVWKRDAHIQIKFF